MQELLFENVSVDRIELPLLKEKEISLAVLRLDRVHPVISGNKWFKLKYYLDDAKLEKKEQILTFGGPYSNHIVATAAAGKMHGLKTFGLIRGERPRDLSHTLLLAQEYGMKLFFMSRSDYRSNKLPREMGSGLSKTYIIAEGGYGAKGATGASEILDYCKKDDFSHIACAVGTSTMMAGLIKGVSGSQDVTGISVLKNNLELERALGQLLSHEEQKKNFRICHEYHFGGYARPAGELMQFMNTFYRETGIPSDFVYTGKLFFGILDMISRDSFCRGSRLLMIHSGGLQGNQSLPKGSLIF